MKIYKTLIYMALLATGSVGAVSAPDDREAILEVSEQWASEFEAGNTASMATYYTNDAVVLPPSSEILSQSEDIQGYWQFLMEVGVNQYDLYPVDVRVEGNRAFQTAIWEAVRTTETGEKIAMEGNITTVLEKQADGIWKITMQSWN